LRACLRLRRFYVRLGLAPPKVLEDLTVNKRPRLGLTQFR
jgi:hypothetical protein